MAYVYKHIRLDTNKPFYVGISKHDDKKYKRAYNKNKRNPIWKKIVSKTNYKVEIIEDNIDIKTAKEKEIELILFYGRLDIGTGSLCNLTDGGDGVWFMEVPEYYSKYLSNRLKEYHSKEGYTQKMVETRIKNFGKKVVQKDLFGNIVKIWNYVGEISRELKKENPNIKISSTNISHCLKGKRPSAGGFRWEYLENPIHFEKKPIKKREKIIRNDSIKVVQRTKDGEFVKIWDYIKQIENEINIKSSNIRKCIKGKRNFAGGYRWEKLNYPLILKKEYLKKELKQKKEKNTKKQNHTKVIQKSISGDFIKIWDYFNQIENETGIHRENVIKCVKGERKTAGGYKWEALIE